MGSGIIDTVDLFGNPIRIGKGARGRPAFQKTEKDVNKIMLLLSMGWSNQRLANSLAISKATLKRHFRAELAIRDQARDQMEAARLLRVWEQAAAGNAAAERQLDRLIERNDLMGLTVPPSDDEEAKAVPKGKKEQAEEAAKAAELSDAWGGDLAFDGGSGGALN